MKIGEEFQGFQFYKEVKVSEVLGDDKAWHNSYGISLNPLGEPEWVEHLSYGDGRDRVMIVITSGPLSKIKNKPVEMKDFASRIPDFVNQAKILGLGDAKVRAIYLIRD